MDAELNALCTELLTIEKQISEYKRTHLKSLTDESKELRKKVMEMMQHLETPEVVVDAGRVKLNKLLVAVKPTKETVRARICEYLASKASVDYNTLADYIFGSSDAKETTTLKVIAK